MEGRHLRTSVVSKCIENYYSLRYIFYICFETTIACSCVLLFFWSLYVVTNTSININSCQLEILFIYVGIIGLLHLISSVLSFVNLVALGIETHMNKQRRESGRTEVHWFKHAKNVSEANNLIKIIFLILSSLYLWNPGCDQEPGYIDATLFIVINFVLCGIQFFFGVLFIVTVFCTTLCAVGGTRSLFANLINQNEADRRTRLLNEHNRENPTAEGRGTENNPNNMV